jgi:hypothetical protein
MCTLDHFDHHFRVFHRGAHVLQVEVSSMVTRLGSLVSLATLWILMPIVRHKRLTDLLPLFALVVLVGAVVSVVSLATGVALWIVTR